MLDYVKNILCSLSLVLMGFSFFFKFCRRKILSPHFSPPLERKGGVDQSTASFTEPMRPSTSHSSVLTTRAMQRQSSGTGLGRSRETEEEENPSDDEVSETLDNNNKKSAKLHLHADCRGLGLP